MKIAIITIHVGANFGSALQCVASQKIFEKIGCEVQIVNYIPDRVTYKRFFSNMTLSLKRLIHGFILLPNFVLNKCIYGGFLRKYTNLSKCYYSENQLRLDPPKADVYVTGSDQVWNSIHNEGFNPIYYYNFLPENACKISLASSFGQKQLPSDECEFVKRLLSSYQYLSVREKSAQQLLGNLDLNSEHLLDPTLILNLNDWGGFIKKRIVIENYVLVYIPYNIVSKELIYDSVRRIAKKYNLKVVTFSWIFLNDKYADRTIKYASPTDFLSLMYYADFVVTNSFHGTAFSVNFNKKFFVYNPSGFSTRISSLLELVGLKSQLLSKLITNDEMQSSIDYNEVNNILELERKKAYSFIQNALNNM